MRRLHAFSLVDILITQTLPGFLFCAGWAVMYEIYHEDGSYYSTLMQEILSGEGLFPYFVVAAVLMAFPVGMIIDSLREVVGEGWLRIPRTHPRERARRSPLSWMLEIALPPDRLAERYLLYRHAWATLLTPAKTAGNLAIILGVFLVWFVIKIVRMQGWHLYSLAFIVGTPVAGLASSSPSWFDTQPGWPNSTAWCGSPSSPLRPPRLRLPPTPFLPPPREGRDRPSPGVTRYVSPNGRFSPLDTGGARS